MPRLSLENLPENVRDLERHFGYREYRDLFEQQKIKVGDSIITFNLLPNKLPSSYRYYAVDAESLRFSPDSELTLKARRQLKGTDWFLDPLK